ncbi:MAG: PD-(D/E)XK nuclease family protein [Bacteroidota bacterium]
MKSQQEIREKYRNLLDDIDFDRMELQLKAPNIFKILNISRTEIRHSNFLAWLLNPNENHGLGRLFLTKFLRGVAISDRADDLDELSIENFNFNNVEIRREWKNIDLLIIFDDLVICIENKFGIKDHSNQLFRYRKVVEDTFKSHKKVFVYLTPTGEEPLTIDEKNYYALYSYEEIIEQIERLIQIHGKSVNQGIYHYIFDYLTVLKREIMKNDELNVLADKIYKSHRELLDFIFENKTDLAFELYPYFVDEIHNSGWILGSKHKGYARFLTSALHDIIPRQGQGWPLKENFLFEIDFFWNKKLAVFKTVIAPGSEGIQKLLSQAMENLKDVPGYKKPSGKKWLVHFKYSWKFETEEFINVNEIDIRENLRAAWPHIKDIVERVEEEFLKVSDDLKRLEE